MKVHLYKMKLIYTGDTGSDKVLSFKESKAKQLCVYSSGATSTNYTSGGTFLGSTYEMKSSTGETEWKILTIDWSKLNVTGTYEEFEYKDVDTWVSGSTGSGGDTYTGGGNGNIIIISPDKDFELIKGYYRISKNFTNCKWGDLALLNIKPGADFEAILVPEDGYEFQSTLPHYGITCVGKSSGKGLEVGTDMNESEGYVTVTINNVQESLTISCECVKSS